MTNKKWLSIWMVQNRHFKHLWQKILNYGKKKKKTKSCRAIQCVLKQTIRHWRKKSQRGHKRRHLAWTRSRYLPSGDFWNPFRPLRRWNLQTVKCLNLNLSANCSKHRQTDEAQPLRYIYYRTLHERWNCGYQVAERPLFLYMQSTISHISSKRTLTSWWNKTGRTSQLYTGFHFCMQAGQRACVVPSLTHLKVTKNARTKWHHTTVLTHRCRCTLSPAEFQWSCTESVHTENQTQINEHYSTGQERFLIETNSLNFTPGVFLSLIHYPGMIPRL